MLPPLDLMGLGAVSSSPVASSASLATPSGQFAANLLAHAQATVTPNTPLRDLDHKTANAEQNLHGLSSLPLTSALTKEDSASAVSNQDMALEDYRLLPVNPTTDSNRPLPPVLPPNGNSLPVTPRMAPTGIDGTVPPVDSMLEGAASLEALDNPQRSVVVHQLATGPDALGLGVRAVDIARAVQDYGEFIKPSADALSLKVDRSATAPVLERSSLNASPSLLPSSLSNVPTAPLEAGTLAVLSTAAALSTEADNALLANRSIATATFSAQPDKTSGQLPQGTPGALRQAGANQNGQLGSMGVPALETVSRLTTALTPLASGSPSSSLSSSPSSPLLPGASSDLPGLSAPLPTPGVAAVLPDRSIQAARSLNHLTAPVARNDGLTTPAGNAIETASGGIATATAPMALRAALASMETRQLATAVEPSASATTTASAVPADSADAITPATPAAVARSTNGAGLLPSGLMPMAPSARLDVSDGMGGQWVGRLSQMIAQQQLTGQSLRIALSPAELGSVELTFSGSADNWAVSLNAQQGQTRDLLESHLDRIRAMLQDLGVSDAQVAMADRWTGGAANSDQGRSDPNHSDAEQSAGWQHSPKVQPTAPQSLNQPPARASGIDAYV